MSPPTQIHPASLLPTLTNTLPSPGPSGKPKPRNPPLDLASCPLKELVQYKCNAEKPEPGQAPLVVCEPVVRLFRVCANGLHVETTAWEGLNARGNAKIRG